jgi:hypothetical protein
MYEGRTMIKRVFEVKWFKENGFFSEEGEYAMMHFKDGLNDLVNKDEMKEMSITQLQTLKSNVLKMVSDALSEEIGKKRAEAAKFAAMTDEQFLAYLDERHGEEFWPIVNGGLNREEEDRLPPAKIRELLEKGAARVKTKK